MKPIPPFVFSPLEFFKALLKPVGVANLRMNSQLIRFRVGEKITFYACEYLKSPENKVNQAIWSFWQSANEKHLDQNETTFYICL